MASRLLTDEKYNVRTRQHRLGVMHAGMLFRNGKALEDDEPRVLRRQFLDAMKDSRALMCTRCAHRKARPNKGSSGAAQTVHDPKQVAALGLRKA